MKELIWAIRGEGDTVECARCGKRVTFNEAEPEEGGEWECVPCNIRCSDLERLQSRRRRGMKAKDPDGKCSHVYSVVEDGDDPQCAIELAPDQSFRCAICELAFSESTRVQELLLKLHQYQRLAHAAFEIYNQERREFARGELDDLDRLEDALAACGELPEAPK